LPRDTLQRRLHFSARDSTAGLEALHSGNFGAYGNFGGYCGNFFYGSFCYA
jgi:hypothetical protein